MKSVEEKVEEHYKAVFDKLGIRHYAKTEDINLSITQALKLADSKSGGSGNNYPDIKLFLNNLKGRGIPVLIEVKGSKGKLEKIVNGDIELVTTYNEDSKPDAKVPHKAGDKKYTTIQQFAVNGALHYGNAILDEGTYKEVIVIGMNGSQINEDGTVKDPEHKAHYVSIRNRRIPKHIRELDSGFELFEQRNVDKLFSILDILNLTEEELDSIKFKAEVTLEERIKKMHQRLYDNESLKTLLSTNEKLYLFCGLIMAGLSIDSLPDVKMEDFLSLDDTYENDGAVINRRIDSFLRKKNCSKEKIEMISNLISPIFKKPSLYTPKNGESIIKVLFKQVKEEIIPCLQSDLHLDFAGKILNSLNDWVSIENDAKNDVVLTPRYVTTFMAHLARTDMNSFVWDKAMGSGGFLVSAMDIMLKDARDKIKDESALAEKIKNIKEKQILGVEILGNIYILAVLNMILMGDGSSNIMNGDSHSKEFDLKPEFPANVFLLNPPYSAPGKGFNFVEEATSQMANGFAAILIQENAGAGQGQPYTSRLLKNNTLIASIHMPDKLFTGKASVQTAIYVFQVGRPHEADDIVKFINFSNDGYARQNRKKSSQEVNLRDVDHAKDRYAEVEAIVLGKKPKTSYYTEANGLYIQDVISMSGSDWTFSQHKKIDTVPTEEDFKKTVADYLAWKVSQLMRGEGNA